MASSPKGYGHRRPKRTRKFIPALLTLCLIIVVFQQAKEQLTSIITNLQPGDGKNSIEPNVAFATLLLAPDTKETNLTEAERYFTSTRILNYQLQHAKHTRSKLKIPFLVLTTPDVPEYQTHQLAHEGATIVPVPFVPVPEWIKPLHPRWQNVLTKIRLFAEITYSRILFLDADTFILRSLDGIFLDPASYPLKTLHNLTTTTKNNEETQLPQTYLLASLPEVLHSEHPYPAPAWRSFNAGFFLFSPSLVLSKYLFSLLKIPNKFDPSYPEQNLLNYVYREGGNMPWQRLGGKHGEWNVNLPNMNDVRKGVRSVHAKLWWEGTDLQPNERELMRRWERVRREMERFYGNRDKNIN